MVSDICTIMIGMMLGRMCTSRIRNSPLPDSRAACTKPALRRTIGLGAGDAGIERKVHDRGRDDDVLHGVAERRDDAHRQHEQRKRHDGVGDAADDAVGPAAEIAGGDAGEPAHQEHQRHRGAPR